MKYLINDENILSGTTVIKNTRIPISTILYLLFNGYQKDEILHQYPKLNKTILEKALSEASHTFDKEVNVSQKITP